MADGANLELKFTGSLDESVRQAFTAITKLLTSIDKAMGSLNSSVEKLVVKNNKLTKSTKDVAEQTGNAIKATKQLEDAVEETATSVEKSTKRMKKSAMEQADIWKVSSKQFMANANVADMYNRKLEQINRNVKRGTREYGFQLTALQRTETAWQKHLKPIDEALKRKIKLEEGVKNLTEYKDTAVTTQQIAAAEKGIKKLQNALMNIEGVITPQAFNELLISYDYNKQFEKNLKSIRKSQIFTETEKHIQKLSEYGDYAVEIYNRLTKGMEDDSAQRRGVLNDLVKYGNTYHKNLSTINADLHEYYKLRTETTDNDELWNQYNDQITRLKKERDALISDVTDPTKAFGTYNTKRSSVAKTLSEVDKVTKYTGQLERYGSASKELFRFLNDGLDKNSFAIDKNYKKVVNFFDKFDSERRRINNELTANNYSFFETDDPKRIKDLGKTRVVLFKQLKALENQYSNANIVNTYAKSESGLKSIFKKWDDIGKKVSWVSAAVQEIQDKTTVGSEQQRAKGC